MKASKQRRMKMKASAGVASGGGIVVAPGVAAYHAVLWLGLGIVIGAAFYSALSWRRRHG